MAEAWKEIRVFISSSFRDMQAERDHLVRFVFPRLREATARRCIRVVDVDLRWGVTEDQDALETRPRQNGGGSGASDSVRSAMSAGSNDVAVHFPAIPRSHGSRTTRRRGSPFDLAECRRRSEDPDRRRSSVLVRSLSCWQ